MRGKKGASLFGWKARRMMIFIWVEKGVLLYKQKGKWAPAPIRNYLRQNCITWNARGEGGHYETIKSFLSINFWGILWYTFFTAIYDTAYEMVPPDSTEVLAFPLWKLSLQCQLKKYLPKDVDWWTWFPTNYWFHNNHWLENFLWIWFLWECLWISVPTEVPALGCAAYHPLTLNKEGFLYRQRNRLFELLSSSLLGFLQTAGYLQVYTYSCC